MPEGDSIRKLAAAIAPDLLGQRLVGGRLAAFPWLSLQGREVTGVRTLGKHLFIGFQDGLTLRTHLGMFGSWHRYAIGEPWLKSEHRASVVLITTQRLLVCFNAAAVEPLSPGGRGEADWTRRLGPDLLAADPDMGSIPGRARALLDPGTRLVDLLLDQRVACGIGNVYKSELLFLHRLAPGLSIADVSDGQLAQLYASARGLLQANLGDGSRRTRRVLSGSGPALWVYRRGRRPCLRCGVSIEAGNLGRYPRSTYWCPACQRRSPG